jgi:hypothetical protein
VSRSVAFATQAKAADAVDVEADVKADTIVYYMGRDQAANIAAQLIARGKPASTPHGSSRPHDAAPAQPPVHAGPDGGRRGGALDGSGAAQPADDRRGAGEQATGTWKPNARVIGLPDGKKARG